MALMLTCFTLQNTLRLYRYPNETRQALTLPCGG
jgi:hypothetical protein